jgi:FlaA1/EpsC-like NDP-sugar epimerase
MTAANSNFRGEGPIFTSTRFGNVLGSRGSVIPIFREQIRQGGPLTLTDPEMTRFIMSIRQAVQLVLDSAFIARGGEVLVTKMPVIRIKDLAEVMIDNVAPHFGHKPENISIEVIGSKPGEKLYEELMTGEETSRSWELERYFVVLPAFACIYRDIVYDYPQITSKTVSKAYHSGNEQPLSKSELLMFLMENNLLFEDISEQRHPSQRYWPNGSCRN